MRDLGECCQFICISGSEVMVEVKGQLAYSQEATWAGQCGIVVSPCANQKSELTFFNLRTLACWRLIVFWKETYLNTGIRNNMHVAILQRCTFGSRQDNTSPKPATLQWRDKRHKTALMFSVNARTLLKRHNFRCITVGILLWNQ